MKIFRLMRSAALNFTKAFVPSLGLLVSAAVHASPPHRTSTPHSTGRSIVRAAARVDRFVVEKRISPAFGGRTFGCAGAYELIIGRMYVSLDPRAAANARIVSLDKAATDATGRVRYSTQVTILKPVDLAKGSGTLVYEVINRSVGGIDLDGKQLDRLGMFDGLMSRGDVIVDAAWQGELSPARLPPNFELFRNQLGGASIYTDFPLAMERGKPLVRSVRFEVEAVNAATGKAANQSALPFRAVSGSPIQAFSRRSEGDDPVALPAGQVRLINNDNVAITPVTGAAIYDIVYRATDAVIAGLGFSVPRELVSFLRNDAGDAVARVNPLLGADGRPSIRRAYAYGFSQSGRYLRMFLWQGFNSDIAGRKVFDGLIPVVAGGRFGFMNGLFVDPGVIPGDLSGHRDAPMFPFAYPVLHDPVTGGTDGILKLCEENHTCPKVMQIDSNFEAAGGWGWMMTTRPDGQPINRQPHNVRLYMVAASDHSNSGGGAAPAICRARIGSIAGYRPVVRAALSNMEEWLRDGVPPPSSYPSLADGTLVKPEVAAREWPKIPSFPYHATSNAPMAYRPGFPLPRAIGAYPLLAIANDADGNAKGGIHLPVIAVPTGTSTGIGGLRQEFRTERDCPLRGEYLPFAKTRAQRQASYDTRLSIEERYPGGAEEIAAQRRSVAQKLVDQRYVLPTDADGLSNLETAE